MLKQAHCRPVHRNSFLSLIAVAIFFIIASASAQGVPHASVDKAGYHTLVPPGSVISASMCQPGNAFCLAAVGQPLLYYNLGQNYGSDPNGNVYVADTNNQIILKISPSGQVTYVAGEYQVQSPSYPPVTQASALTVLQFPGNLVGDSEGDLYFSTGYATSTVVMKIDSAGVAHRLTAPSSLATAKPVEGALASSQYVSPSSLSLSASGDLYIADGNTCTVRVLSAKTGTLDTKYGSLGAACSGVAPKDGQKVGSANVYGSGVALGSDGTVYFSFGNTQLYSVTTDGTAHLLATCQNCTGYSASAYAGPASSASIGLVGGAPTLDAAGDLYFAASGANNDSSGNPPFTLYSYLVEVTKGSKAQPSQILILASAQGGYPFTNLNVEGAPSNLIVLSSGFALDSSGRIFMDTENPYPATGSVDGYGVAYLDRNGAGVFSAPSSQTFTLTNSGSAPLKTLSFARTGLPFYISPTAVELKDFGLSGPAPFNLNLTSGTCVSLYLKSDGLTLQPGESCTIVIDYKPNADLPATGSFTLQTNDPRGPLTLDFSVSSITTVNSPYLFGDFNDTYYGLTISSTVLTASSPVGSNGSLKVEAAVASSIFDPNAVGTAASGEIPVVPTGRVLVALTNNSTGAVTISSASTLDAEGKTSFSFTGLAAGSYSLEGAYLGDGKSAASYSTVQTVTVAAH